MSKAKPSSKTAVASAAEPTLFTHDGYRLHIFDGVPCMLDIDLGNRLGMAEERAIRKLIERQAENLHLLEDSRQDVAKPGHGVAVSSTGLRRRPADRRPRSRGPIGHAYYLTQQQVRWVVVKSEAPQADVLLRQLFAVFDAWEKGELVSRAETAEAKLQRPRIEPQSRAFNRSLFAYGVPRAVPSNLVYAIAKDARFVRFHTSLGITGTVIGDGLTVLAQDLGFVTGGECTLTARTATRPLLPRLRVMGADPAYELEVQGVRNSVTQETHYFLNHEQAKALAECLDPHGQSSVQHYLDMLFYKAARGQLAEIALGEEGAKASAVIDGRAKRKGSIADARYAAEPVYQPPLRYDGSELPDPYIIAALADMAEKIVMPLTRQIDDMTKQLGALETKPAAVEVMPSVADTSPSLAVAESASLAIRIRRALDAFRNPNR